MDIFEKSHLRIVIRDCKNGFSVVQNGSHDGVRTSVERKTENTVFIGITSDIIRTAIIKRKPLPARQYERIRFAVRFVTVRSEFGTVRNDRRLVMRTARACNKRETAYGYQRNE